MQQTTKAMGVRNSVCCYGRSRRSKAMCDVWHMNKGELQVR